MADSAENALAKKIVEQINNKKVLIKKVERGTDAHSIIFDVFPAAIVWYHTTNYPDNNAPIASGTGATIDTNSNTLWVSEYPLYGAVVFASNQEEALEAMEELKGIVSGYFPLIDGRDTQFPLHPAHYSVPFRLSDAECVGIYFELGWQYRNDITT